MPIYEYECRKCKAHVEILQKITDKPLVKCRKCGGKLEKQWSTTSFQLKGTGWYATDYASKKSGEEKTGDKTEPTKTTTPAATTNNAADKSNDKSKATETPAPKKTRTNTAASNTNTNTKNNSSD
jgi:putative FmdB family regulatory protein